MPPHRRRSRRHHHHANGDDIAEGKGDLRLSSPKKDIIGEEVVETEEEDERDGDGG